MLNPLHRHARRALALAAGLSLALAASASTVASRNVVHLIENAQDIVVGTVTGVRDGVDAKGVPYTEVTLALSETLRGNPQKTMSFRQFGLLKPRVMPNGRTLYSVRPQGWPEYHASERVLLFLTRPAAQTGLRTTVGLEQGKFLIANDRLRSAGVMEDGALFDGVGIAAAAMTPDERALVAASTKTYNATDFIAFVRRAVAQRWVETGSLRHAP